MVDNSIFETEDIIADEYKIQKVYRDDIIDMMNLPEEKVDITKDIITNLEKTIIEAIKIRNVAMLPYLGCIRYKPIQMALRPHYEDMRKFRKVFGKELYKMEMKRVCRGLYHRRLIYDDFKYDQYIRKQYAPLLNKYQRGWQNLFIWFRKSLIPINPTEE